MDVVTAVGMAFSRQARLAFVLEAEPLGIQVPAYGLPVSFEGNPPFP